MTPVDWARALYTATVTPLANTAVATGMLFVVLLLVLAWWVLRTSRWWGGVDGHRQGRALLRTQRIRCGRWPPGRSSPWGSSAPTGAGPPGQAMDGHRR